MHPEGGLSDTAGQQKGGQGAVAGRANSTNLVGGKPAPLGRFKGENMQCSDSTELASKILKCVVEVLSSRGTKSMLAAQLAGYVYARHEEARAYIKELGGWRRWCAMQDGKVEMVGAADGNPGGDQMLLCSPQQQSTALMAQSWEQNNTSHTSPARGSEEVIDVLVRMVEEHRGELPLVAFFSCSPVCSTLPLCCAILKKNLLLPGESADAAREAPQSDRGDDGGGRFEGVLHTTQHASAVRCQDLRCQAGVLS
eukprot:655076-Rhodomonas_salina.1